MLILIYNFEGERKHREEIASLKGSRQPLERRPAWDFFFFFLVPSLKVALWKRETWLILEMRSQTVARSHLQE